MTINATQRSMREYTDRQKQAGLVSVRLWVPEGKVDAVKRSVEYMKIEHFFNAIKAGDEEVISALSMRNVFVPLPADLLDDLAEQARKLPRSAPVVNLLADIKAHKTAADACAEAQLRALLRDRAGDMQNARIGKAYAVTYGMKLRQTRLDIEENVAAIREIHPDFHRVD